MHRNINVLGRGKAGGGGGEGGGPGYLSLVLHDLRGESG